MNSETEVTIAPADLDVGSAPRVRADVVAVAVGDETVLLGQFGQSHVLNPTGALVAQFLDGQATLGELVTDFTEVLEADPAVVRADLVEFTRTLGRSGLLDGVVEPVDVGDFLDLDWEPAAALEVGQLLEPFTLPDLDGVDTPIEAWRGRRVLLVNWSPDCGFCVKIADALARARPTLAAQGVDLVLVTSGDAEGNRAALDDAGLDVVVLVKRVDVDPFAGFGTPAAYLLDEEGRLAAPMALGAVDVPRFAGDLAGIDLGNAGSEPAPDEVAEGLEDARYLPAPSAMCGPGGGAGAPSTAWAGTRAYRLGEYHVGIRYDSAGTAALLDRLFVGERVHDTRVPDNFSVALHPGAGGGSRKLNLLVHGSTQLVRSRSAARALAGLLAHVSLATAPDEPDPTMLRVHATAAVRDGNALLLPPGLLTWVKELQPRLARRDIVLVDVPIVTIDPAAAELVVPEPWVPHDPTVLDEVDEGVRLGAELPYVRPGRYPITHWYLMRAPDERGALSPAVGVAAAYGLVADLADPRRVGGGLAALFARVRAHGVWLDRPEALDAQLDAA